MRLILLISIALLLPAAAQAVNDCGTDVPRQRCLSGHRTAIGRSNARRSLPARPDSGKRSARQSADGRYARIISCELQRLADGRGSWSGKLEGNGEIVLTLLIRNARGIVQRLGMGSVTLPNMKTTFDFRGALPKEPAWTWSVEAFAR